MEKDKVNRGKPQPAGKLHGVKKHSSLKNGKGRREGEFFLKSPFAKGAKVLLKSSQAIPSIFTAINP